MTSARLLRKSDNATRPTVCVERRSSAVFCCEVNRGLGVDVREGGLDAMVLAAIVELLSMSLFLRGTSLMRLKG